MRVCNNFLIMELNNIKNLLLKSLNKTWKQNQIISSIIYKSIVDDFLKIKKIDITNYVISTKLSNNVIILKTNSPILNTEILTIENELIKNINNKLKNISSNIVFIKIILK